MADTDNNQLLSFSEYSFFVSLLSTQESEFKLAFQLFDIVRVRVGLTLIVSLTLRLSPKTAKYRKRNLNQVC